MSDTLKPCPFCGGRMEPHHRYPKEHRHEYRRGERCPAAGTVVYLDDAPAIAAWNRRAPQEPTND